MGMHNKNIIMTEGKAERGFTMPGTIVIMTFLSFATASVMDIVSADSGATANQMDKTRAFYASHAGLEWAERRLSLGRDPTVTDKSFGDGKFTVTSGLNGKVWQVASTGAFGIGKSTQTIEPKFAVDCVDFGDRIVGQSVPDVNFGPDYGAIYSLKVKFDNTKDGCGHMRQLFIEKVTISNLRDSQKIVQVYYDGTDAGGTAGSDDYFNRYGQDYLRSQTIVPSVNAPTPTSLFPERADVLDIRVSDTDVHNFNELYIDYDSESDRPQRGDSFAVTVSFRDGSSYNYDVVY